MFEEFHSFEESLKEFLAVSQTDNYTSRNANLYKYNNLKIYMDPAKHKTPHFIIRIGISEAIYDIEDGEKISGSLGPDDREVRRWIDRNLSNMNLKMSWIKSKKVKPVIMKKDLDE